MYRALIEKKNNQKGNRIFYDCFFAHAFQNEVGEQFDVYIGCSFLFLNVKTVMFFLCTVERYSIIKPVFCISLKAIIRKSANQMKVWDAKLQGL